MKEIAAILQQLEWEDFVQCLGTGFCMLIAESAPVLGVIALIYQIRYMRAKALHEEKRPYREEVKK